MNRIFHLVIGTVFAAVPAFATLDIVQKDGEGTVYLLKNAETGKVLGTFWDRENDASDYGFESSIVPDFLWSADRTYVAVTAGASRSRAVSLYRATGNTLKEIEVPQLTPAQSAKIDAIADVAASGTDAVRWQPDGSLLLRFWADGTVQSENEVQKTAQVWAELEVVGNSASIVGTSTEEPSAPANAEGEPASAESVPDEGFSPERLAGVHPMTGKNPDGSSYKGTVEIRVVNGVVGIEWKIGDSVSRGQGVLVGQTLGIALDSGLVIYRLYGQSEGQSLIGVWATADSSKPGSETILIGNADMTTASVEPNAINGRYLSLREVNDGQIEGKVKISGGDIVKTLDWTFNGKTTKTQGLALGDGFAALTPFGISVFEIQPDHSGSLSLAGRALLRNGSTGSESLSPVD